MSAPRTRRQHLQQTAAYLAAVTGIPALLRSGSSSAAGSGEAGAEGGDEHRAVRENRRSFLEHERASFDTRPREVLAKEGAEYLFFGDSMARAHIDPDVVTRLTGKKGGVFYLAHSTSARWYLMLKNYVIPSGAKPKKMFVLFRNCIWHMPTFRIDGSCWEDIERAMEDPADPVISQVIGLESRRGASPAAQLLREDVYPIQTHGESLRQGIQEAAAKLCGLDFEQAKALTNAYLPFVAMLNSVDARPAPGGQGLAFHGGGAAVPIPQGLVAHVVQRGRVPRVQVAIVFARQHLPVGPAQVAVVAALAGGFAGA